MSATAAIVLAGGASTRMGRPKQLVRWHDRPLLEHVVASVLRWPVASVVVVLGAHAEEILDEVDFGDALVAINDDWEEGIASSLRVGFDVLSRDAGLEAAFVVLGDQPSIPEDVPASLLYAAEETERPALVPLYRYQRAHPVLFRRLLWERLMSLEGDVGAGDTLKAHPDWVEEVRVDHAPPRDIDTESDLRELLARGGRPSPDPSPGH